MKSRFATPTLLISGLLMILPNLAWTDEIADRQQAAKQVTGQLVKQLGGEMKKEMGSNGPAGAISVCRDAAPQITSELSRKHGWRITRVSEKVRNPMLGMADDWELKILKDFRARASKGEKYTEMAFSEVIEEGGQKYFRFMKAIGTQPVCLSCHGSSEQIPANVQARLQEDYPNDTAIGYKAGDLRGAVSIKQPMNIPLNK
ncbi:MAG: DUF3365 domain-containing protein [Gammaproteobacteria bacterium]